MIAMKNRTKRIITMVACLCGYAGLYAQDTEFDLNSQRSESQDVWAVPGQKNNRQSIKINPVPHDLRLVEKSASLRIASGFAVQDKKQCFAENIDFLSLNKKGVRLIIDFDARKAVRQGVKAVSGAYSLQVTPKGICVLGYDERGAFYGLQTLRELLESAASSSGNLPCLTINDYPDLPNRGVVEGFYGTPWSHQVRMSLIDSYGKYKMNVYLYGPKDDPYHSCPNWRLPYPKEEAKHIVELIEACKRNRVDFVWAIHPGQDIKWNEEDYQNLVQKFNWMYDLGVRSFALFFDDISGEGANPHRQVELLNRLSGDFVKAKGDVASLIVCPTDYSRLWANPTPQGSLAIYGQTLDPAIKVFWTGDVVCSDLTKDTMSWLNQRIKRPGFYWWNFPVTDYARHILMQGPVYGLDTSLTDTDLCGIVSNPMEHGEASKLGIYGVADYAWNVAAYNPIDNWERGLEVMMPQAYEAYRTFAIHSCDTENGYRRDESWETKTFRIGEWDELQAQALWNEYDKVERTPAQIEKGCENKALLKELRPWLVEFGKLGTRGKRVIDLARIYRDGRDNAAFWNNYVDNLMSEEGRKNYEAHKSGTMKLQPFYENAMDDMAFGFFQKLTGEVPMEYKGIGSFSTARTMQVKLMLDGDDETHYTSGMPQRADAWIGVDLRAVRDVRDITILQGRNSVDDVDYFDHAVLEVSTDGNQWQPLLDDMQQQYEIRWKGEPVKARYVRLRRLESARTNYAAVRTFQINPIRLEDMNFKIEASDPQQALAAFDSRLSTAYVNRGVLLFEVQPDVQKYIFLLGNIAPDAPVQLCQYSADGTVLSRKLVTASYVEFPLVPGAVKVQFEGTVEVYEVIAQ